MSDFAFVQCIDNSFTGNMMCLASCQSIIKNSYSDCYVILLDDNQFISFYKKLGVKTISANKFYFEYCQKLDSHAWSKFVYVRFMIFKEQLFKDYKMVIYMDADTYITKNIDADLKSLNDRIDVIGMVNESPLSYQFHMSKIISVLEKNKLSIGCLAKNYFNAGVILLKNKVLTNDNFNKLIDLCNKYSSQFISNDQDILNYYFNIQITKIDNKYNLFNDTYVGSEMHKNNIAPTDQNIVIWHYAGIPKHSDKVNCMLSRMQQNINNFIGL